MQISSRFTIATHMMIIIAIKSQESKVTSDFLAASVGVNPVIIRKTLSQLKKAELISVARGTGGTEIIKDLQDISLFDIYQAVECLGKSGKLFSFMTIQILIVQLVLISMRSWTKSCLMFKQLWRTNFVRQVWLRL